MGLLQHGDKGKVRGRRTMKNFLSGEEGFKIGTEFNKKLVKIM